MAKASNNQGNNQDKREDKVLGLVWWALGKLDLGDKPSEWRVTRSGGLFRITDEERKTVERITVDSLVDEIRDYAFRTGMLLRPAEETTAAKLLKNKIPSIEERLIDEPRLIGGTEHEGYALSRLDYSLKEEAKKHFDTMGQDLCPFLKDVQESLEEPGMWDMLKCWIGKMLLEDSNAPEVLIWFGKGGDGKTTFFQSLQGVLGGNVANVISQRTLTDRWGAIQVIDRRLVVVEEADDSHKIWTPELKMITGNEVISVERKYKDPIFVPNKSMVAVVTNAEPALDKQSRAQLRRLRLIVSKPVVRTKVRTQREIAEEFKSVSRAFFGACVAAYLERGCVPVNSGEVIDELSEDTLGPVMSFARSSFVYEEGAFLSNQALRDIMTARAVKHSLKNVKTAIGNLDKRIDIDIRRYVDGERYRGISNVVYCTPEGLVYDPASRLHLPGTQTALEYRAARKAEMNRLNSESELPED